MQFYCVYIPNQLVYPLSFFLVLPLLSRPANSDSRIQVHFGSIWPLSFAALLRAKFPSHYLHRKIALEGHRFSPSEAQKDGLVDFLVGSDYVAKGAVEGGVLGKATELADKVGGSAKGGVWGLIKVCCLVYYLLLREPCIVEVACDILGSVSLDLFRVDTLVVCHG